MKFFLVSLLAFWQICYSGNIQITNHDDTQLYWLAMFITGSCKTITKVQVRDSGNYGSWYKYTADDPSTDFWAFDNNGNAFTTPITVRVTFDDGTRKKFNNIITKFDAGEDFDTSWSSACDPTNAPVTADPTSPTAAPITLAPTTSAPTSEGQECHSADASNFVWSSVGSSIYLNGKKITFKGVAWFGFETPRYMVDGLGSEYNGGHSYTWYFDFLQTHGFTAIRLPFSQDMIDNNPTPSSSQYNAGGNSIFSGLSSIECMDVIIEEAASRGMLIMLDFHSKNAGSWTDGLNSLSSWSAARAAWRVLAQRYKNQWNIFMADIYNEPHDVSNSEWSNWIDFVEYIGQDLIDEGANWLMAVQGTNWDCGSTSCWWGENLINAGNDAPKFTNTGRVVWSPHVYGPDLGYKPYDFGIFNNHWGYIVHDDTIDGAIVVGEFGTRYNDQSKQDWLDTLVSYLISIDQRSHFFWCLNANSGDTGGLLADDWTTIQSEGKMLKLDELSPNPTQFTVEGGTVCWEGGADGGDTGTYTHAPTAPTDSPTSKPTIVVSGDDITIWSRNGVSEWWYALAMSAESKDRVDGVRVQGANYGDTWSTCYFAWWEEDVFACDISNGVTFSLPITVELTSMNGDVSVTTDAVDSFTGRAQFTLTGFSNSGKNNDDDSGSDGSGLSMAEVIVIVIVLLVAVAVCAGGGYWWYNKKYKGQYDMKVTSRSSKSGKGSNKGKKSPRSPRSDDDLILGNGDNNTNDDGRRTPTDSADRILRAAKSNEDGAAIVVPMDVEQYATNSTDAQAVMAAEDSD